MQMHKQLLLREIFCRNRFKFFNNTRCLTKIQITLSDGKCRFHQITINDLGFEIFLGIIKLVQSNIVKVTSFLSPKNVEQVKNFVGLYGFNQVTHSILCGIN